MAAGKRTPTRLAVAKWGNSLALRIPSDVVGAMGVREGDRLEAYLTVDGGLHLRPGEWRRQAFARELDRERESMAVTQPVLEQLRRGARY